MNVLPISICILLDLDSDIIFLPPALHSLKILLVKFCSRYIVPFLSKNVFLLYSLLKDILARYTVLCGLIFSFSTLEKLLLSLAYTVDFKNYVFIMDIVLLKEDSIHSCSVLISCISLKYYVFSLKYIYIWKSILHSYCYMS